MADALANRKRAAREDLARAVVLLRLSTEDIERRLRTGSPAALIGADARGAAGTIVSIVQYASELSALEETVDADEPDRSPAEAQAHGLGSQP